MVESIKIANRRIGRDHPPFVVAEMSGNHNQSLARALEIVDAAAKTGAHGYVMRPLIKIGGMVGETSS